MGGPAERALVCKRLERGEMPQFEARPLLTPHDLPVKIVHGRRFLRPCCGRAARRAIREEAADPCSSDPGSRYPISDPLACYIPVVAPETARSWIRCSII